MDVRKRITKVRALQLSLVSIASVVVVEGAIGALTNSLAILSDAAHALFDTITTVILLVTTQLSLRPPDEEHLYGHGKIEPIGGLIGGIALIFVAALLFLEAGTHIVSGEAVKKVAIGFGAIGYTLAVDIFRIATLWGSSRGSVTVRVGFYHALSDFASTVIALLGFGLAFVGITGADPVASIVLASLLVYLSVGLVRSSGADLIDQISRTVVQDIRKEISGVEGVSVCRELKARRVGTKTYVETTICVPSSMGLHEAHDVASQIENKITQSHGDSSVTVHIEPLGPEKPIEKQIESLASVEGVKSVHNLSIAHSKGKLFITLHIMVDPAMSLEKAHGIADVIEQNLRQQIGDVEHVTVHLEPYAKELRREFLLEDAQVETMIRQILEAYPSVRSVKRIVTYEDEQGRHINVDCSFDKTVSVEVMHETVSRIESEIRKRFRESVVTIHAEPSA